MQQRRREPGTARRATERRGGRATAEPSLKGGDADLDVQHERAAALGARLLADRAADADEPLRVYADPAGHPFCIFVAASVTQQGPGP